MGVKKLSIKEKSRALAWASLKMSTKVIAQKMGRSQRSIQKLLLAARDLPENTTPKRKPGSGRPKSLTNTDLRVIKRFVIANPTITAARLKIELSAVVGHLSERRIQSVLQKDLKLLSRSAAKKPLLTKAMKQKRLAFCHKYKNWTEEQWSNVMFTDESMFKCIRSASAKVRRPKGSNRFDPRFTVKTVKHPAQVMVWGCFSGSGGKGGLYFLPKGQMMNGDHYKMVLEEHLLPAMERLQATHFLQDGAPCHKSKKVKDLLAQADFEVMDWPGNSPDLNPIENCWNHMKDMLKFKNTISQDLLETEIQKLWDEDEELSQGYLRDLSNSMPKRIKMVIKNKGEMTKY